LGIASAYGLAMTSSYILSGGMLVFVFTDIEGSTQLWEKHTAGMDAAIACPDQILHDQIRAGGGRITKHTGDGVTAAFEGGQPLDCALETQRQFAQTDWEGMGPLQVQVGLHAAPPLPPHPLAQRGVHWRLRIPHLRHRPPTTRS
jgi:class 3 adenylate cyclase